MSLDKPLICVAIPTRNRPGSLFRALESVLAQGDVNLEIIVSDNNSTSDLLEGGAAIRDSKVKYFRHTRDLSMTENWNFCLEKASGEYFLLLSDDDYLLPGALTAMLSAVNGKDIAFAYGRARFENRDGKQIGLSSPAPERESGSDFIRATLRGKRHALPSFTLLRTASARAFGGYPETGNSTDLALRLSLALDGDVAFVNAITGVYQIHSGSMTSDVDKTIESFRLFSNWVEGSRLSKWKEPVREYCALSLWQLAKAYALRGELVAAKRLSSHAEQISGPRWQHSLVLCAMGFWPIRILASLRRQAKRALFSRRSNG